MYHLPDPSTLPVTMKPEHPEPSLSINFSSMALSEGQADHLRLPPIHEYLKDLDTSRRSSASSVSSASSAGDSSLQASRSTSPSVISLEHVDPARQDARSIECLDRLDLEPSYHHDTVTRRLRMYNDHFQPYPTPLGSPIQPSYKCSANKPIRGRRSDRAAYASRSRQEKAVVDPPKSAKKKVAKKNREAGARWDLGDCLARLQSTLLKVNPSFPQQAAATLGREVGGWRELKSNNIASDIDNPLRHNKIHVMESGITVIEHDAALLQAVSEERAALEYEAAALIQSKASPNKLHEFLEKFAYGGWAALVAESTAKRGCHGFQLPQPSGLPKKM